MLRVDLQPYTLHFARPAATSRGALTERRILLLAASNRDNPGVIGWGECGPLPGLSRDEFLELAENAKKNCPVSRALTGTSISLEAELL